MNGIMLGSEDSKRLADFYTKVLGDPNPEWSDPAHGWFGFQAGDGSLAVGPHSEVKGTNPQPGRILLNFAVPDVSVAEPYEPQGAGGMKMCTFADPDGNYFQIVPPWNPESS